MILLSVNLTLTNTASIQSRSFINILSTSYIDFNNSSEKARVDKSKLFFALNSISTLRHLNFIFITHLMCIGFWATQQHCQLIQNLFREGLTIRQFPVSIPDTSCLNKPSLRDSPRLVYIGSSLGLIHKGLDLCLWPYHSFLMCKSICLYMIRRKRIF